MRRCFVWLAAAALGLGAACLVYSGPGRPFVRGHVGDVAAAMLLYAAFGLTAWPRRVRIAATIAVALAVELGQLVWSPLGRTPLGALTLGSVFDCRDLVAYAAGLVAGLVWERHHVIAPARQS